MNDEQQAKKPRPAAWLQIGVFLAFLCVLLALHLILPDKELSGRESLQTLPRFSFSSLFSGRFTKQAEDYVNDQFPFRDGWLTLKAAGERAAGKDQNNGIYLCANETLIEPFTAPDYEALDVSLEAIKTLGANTDAPVYFALIPTAAEIWRDKLPAGAPNDSQRELIQYAYRKAGVETIDLYHTLASHASEPIFYRTDHHWTTLGAYYAYAVLAEKMGLAPAPLSDYKEQTVTESFYGTGWSTSNFRWVAPDSIQTYIRQGRATVTNYPAGSPEPGTLYDETALEGIDKYAYFYGGNTSRLVIDTGHPGSKLLILRDSYMDSLSPFFFPHFSEIHILDLRYYKTSLKAYIEEQGFDRVLVCYSVKNFVEDSSLFLAGY